MGHIHRGDLGQPSALRPYLVARFIRIYPPFWCILVALILMQVVMGRLEPVLQGNPWAWVQAFLLLPFDGVPPLTAAWTLSHEILFYLVFGLCILLGRGGFIVFGIWMLCCAGVFSRAETLTFPTSFLLSPNNLLFGIGLLAAAFFGQTSAASNRLVLAGGAGLFLVITALGRSLEDDWQIVAYGVASGLLVHGIANLELQGRVRVPRPLERLGDASYSIYLAHGPAMAFAAILLSRFDVTRSLSPVPSTLVLVAVGLIVGIVFHLFVERPLLGWMRRTTKRPFPPISAHRSELP